MSIFNDHYLNNRLNIVQALFMKNCLLCGTKSGDDFCKACRNSLPCLTHDRCVVCALPVKGSQICGACLANPPAFGRSVAALEYKFPIDALLQRLKYGANLAMARVLADLLFSHIDNTVDLPDFIVPMPLHPGRLRERGFNQALELGRRISKKTGIALLPDVCHRVRDTPSQTGLPWKETRTKYPRRLWPLSETGRQAYCHTGRCDDHRRHLERTGESTAQMRCYESEWMGGRQNTTPCG